MAHTEYSVLQERIEAAKNKINVGGRYHHWKDLQTVYVVEGLGFDQFNEDLVVVYRNEALEFSWIRSLEGEEGWLVSVEERPGDDKRRFIPVEELA